MQENCRHLTGHHGKLVMDWRAGPNKDAKLLRNRALFPPLDQRVENEFVTA